MVLQWRVKEPPPKFAGNRQWGVHTEIGHKIVHEQFSKLLFKMIIKVSIIIIGKKPRKTNTAFGIMKMGDTMGGTMGLSLILFKTIWKLLCKLIPHKYFIHYYFLKCICTGQKGLEHTLCL